MRYLLLFLMVVSCQLHAQQTTIKILDSHSRQPVFQANICLESLSGKSKDFTSTDTGGIARVNITSRSSVAVSAIGYKTLLDTIKPGGNKILYIFPSAYDINEVVVTGQHTPVKADKSIYKIDVINSVQIKERAANNLSDLLATELKLRVSQDGPLGTNISLQGLSGEHIKILVDGVPVIGRQGGVLDLSQVLLSNVDHIEIIEGPMSVIYGTNALAGAINIITKQPKSGKVNGKVDLNYESVGIYNAEAVLSVLSKKNSITVNGGRNFFGGHSFDNSSRVMDWKPKEQYFTGLDYVLTEKKYSLKVGGNIFREKLLNAGPLDGKYILDTIWKSDKIIDTIKTFVARYASDQYHYTTRINAKVEHQYTFNEKSNLNTTLSIAIYEKVKKTYVKDFTDLTETLAASSSQDTTKFRNYILRTVYSNSLKYWLDLMSGADFNIEKGFGKRLKGDKRIDDYAGFINMKFFSHSKLNMQIGGRAIYNSRFKAPFIYSVNFRYAPLETFDLRASYGKGFRSPSLKELFLIFQDVSHNIQGNDSLKAENSHNYSISGDYTFFPNTNHTFTVSSNVFYNRIGNKIDFLYDINNPTWAKYYNIPSNHYVTKGIEFTMKYNFHPRFTFSSGVYFLSKSKISDLNSYFNSTDYSFDFNYKNLKYLFRMSAYYKYTDDWYTSGRELTKTGEERIIDGFMKGYSTLNITLSRPFFKNRFDCAIGGKNLFNNTSVISKGIGQGGHNGGGGNSPVGWGRTFFIKVTYNFLKT